MVAMTRRSKSEIERSLDDLDDGDALPEAGLIRILSAERAGECESVDGAPGLIRCHGDVYRISRNARETLRELSSEGA